MTRDFNRERFEALLLSLRKDVPEADSKPVEEFSDEALVTEVDRLTEKAWVKLYLG